MGHTRKRSSLLKQSHLLQEADSRCPFCQDSEVAIFEFHHIDGDPSNGDLSNLIAACGSFHSKIEKGILSQADVVTRKRELAWRLQTRVSQPPTGVQVNLGPSSSFRGNVAQSIRISGVRTPRVAHPLGSIGANLAMKGYVDYLLGRYFGYRKADSSYGQMRTFSPAVIHQNIQREFGAKTFFLPESAFDRLIAYLARHIDNTIQGRRNVSQGRPNYHSFEEHRREHSL